MTPVLVHVDSTPSAMLSTIPRSVHAWKIMKEIPLQVAIPNHLQVRALSSFKVPYSYKSLSSGKEPVFDDPCNPSPCGSNAQCANGICTCLPEYQGDPYAGCRPECVINNDCPRDKACIRNKCKDPCPGTCGQTAICDVINHIPMCSCPQGTTGKAFVNCSPYQSMFHTLFLRRIFLILIFNLSAN